MTPSELKARYEQGENITALMREAKRVKGNDEEIIEVAYDLQAGTYTAGMEDAGMARHKADYSNAIAAEIMALCKPASLLEAGVGEATTLSGVISAMPQDIQAFGFDLCWSRIAFARKWLASKQLDGAVVCTGSLFNIPFLDDSIDVVYTSHSIEPNGGQEIPILKELLRVARRYVVLLEPGYELASEEARIRMDSLGYCRGIAEAAAGLGCKVLDHRLFAHSVNPLNPTALTILEKVESSPKPVPANPLACPKYKTGLEYMDGQFFSRESLTVYPVVGGVPCLRIEHGVIASKFPEFVRE